MTCWQTTHRCADAGSVPRGGALLLVAEAPALLLLHAHGSYAPGWAATAEWDGRSATVHALWHAVCTSPCLGIGRCPYWSTASMRRQAAVAQPATTGLGGRLGFPAHVCWNNTCNCLAVHLCSNTIFFRRANLPKPRFHGYLRCNASRAVCDSGGCATAGVCSFLNSVNLSNFATGVSQFPFCLSSTISACPPHCCRMAVKLVF